MVFSFLECTIKCHQVYSQVLKLSFHWLNNGFNIPTSLDLTSAFQRDQIYFVAQKSFEGTVLEFEVFLLVLHR